MKPAPPTAIVTTEDTCSNCGAKLTNAETARLNWQGEAARVGKLYDELIYAVARVFPGESRHETALRYINEAERTANNTPPADSMPKPK